MEDIYLSSSGGYLPEPSGRCVTLVIGACNGLASLLSSETIDFQYATLCFSVFVVVVNAVAVDGFVGICHVVCDVLVHFHVKDVFIGLSLVGVVRC